MGCFVRALRWVQGTCFILGALWDLAKVAANIMKRVGSCFYSYGLH